jgi:putative flippase GtrA
MLNQQSKQLVRYIVVGAASNAAGYALYLFLTNFELPPKIAMTLLYMTTAGFSFFGNRKITFVYEGDFFGAGTRFLIAQTIGYLINLFILMIFVDNLGYNHKIVQAVAIFTVAVYLFFSLKLFVFRRVV